MKSSMRIATNALLETVVLCSTFLARGRGLEREVLVRRLLRRFRACFFRGSSVPLPTETTVVRGFAL
jgi:hypothetical protein